MTDYGDVKRIPDFVLLIVMVGLVLGAGIIVVDKLGETSFYQRNNYNISLTNTTNNTARSLTYGNLTSTDSVKLRLNQTTLDSSCYDINTTKGFITIKNEGADSATCHNVAGGANTTGLVAADPIINLSVVIDFKDFNTKTKTATKATVTELGKIPTDWLGLIITIVVLAIIITIVIKAFGFARTGRE